jgi:hypothetical protein
MSWKQFLETIPGRTHVIQVRVKPYPIVERFYIICYCEADFVVGGPDLFVNQLLLERRKERFLEIVLERVAEERVAEKPAGFIRNLFIHR